MTTMGMRLLRGRRIERSDVERNEPSVVVNQAFVDAYMPRRIHSAGASVWEWRRARVPLGTR